MKLQLFTILDTKTGIHSQPFCSQNEFSAIRMFTHTVNCSDTQISQTPEDFVLFNLGSWDDETAMVTQVIEGKLAIGTGIDYKNPLLQEQQT